jgi:two-component system OmpR family response regulator
MSSSSTSVCRTPLVRRGGRRPVKAGALEVDEATHALVLGSRSVPLTPTEFRIAARLAVGGIVDRDDLMAAAWPGGTFINPNTLDAYIVRLRRKLIDLGVSATIRTVHGVGNVLE